MSVDFAGAGGLSYDLVIEVETFPAPDTKTSSTLTGKFPGGFIANATAAAARLGLRCTYLGWAGADSEGEMLKRAFEADGIDVDGLVLAADETTPFCVVMVNQTGERVILVPDFPLYARPLTDEQLARARSARIIYTFPRDKVWCERLAGANPDGLFVLDVEHAARSGELADMIAMADVAFLSKSTLAALGLTSLADAPAGDWNIMTDGQHGAYGWSPGYAEPVFQPAFRVKAIDTTGAGDCFHAALLAAKLWDYPLPDALTFASAAAAIKVGHRGARGGLPSRAEVQAFLKGHRQQPD